MTKLKEILLLRESLIEEKQMLHERLTIVKNKVQALNSVLDSFGVENYTAFERDRKFCPIINEKMNKGFFK